MLRKSFLKLILASAPVLMTSLATERQPQEITGITYPHVARLARISGTVVLRLMVAPDGKVKESVSVSGHPVLAAAAKKNADEWRFESREGRGINLEEVYLVYRFRLRGSCAGYDCRSQCVIDFPNVIVVTSEIPPIQVYYSQ